MRLKQQEAQKSAQERKKKNEKRMQALFREREERMRSQSRARDSPEVWDDSVSPVKTLFATIFNSSIHVFEEERKSNRFKIITIHTLPILF